VRDQSPELGKRTSKNRRLTDTQRRYDQSISQKKNRTHIITQALSTTVPHPYQSLPHPPISKETLTVSGIFERIFGFQSMITGYSRLHTQ
jgi:hypothetical protein